MKKFIALALALLLPAQAAAQGLKYIPKWEMHGGRACYDGASALRLLEIDERYDHCLESKKLLLNEIDSLKLQLDNTTLALNLSTQLELSWRNRAESLDKRLQVAIKERNDAVTNKAPAMGWTIAGALVLVGGGIALGYWMARE